MYAANQSQKESVQAYFDGQNRSDSDAVSALFVPNAEVYNVNLPKVTGLAGIKTFCDNLYARTSHREFKVTDLAFGQDVIMAHWQANLSFRTGAQIGVFKLANGFDVVLKGVNRFEFRPGSCLIQDLRIYHETTTVGTLAKDNAATT